MSNVAIRVENLSKHYRIGVREKRANTLRERLGNLAASPFGYLRTTLRGPSEEETIWTLKDVSFEACPELAEGSNAARWWTFLRLRSGQALATTGWATLGKARGQGAPCSEYSRHRIPC